LPHALEEVVPGELHREIAGKAVRALDDDRADAVAGDAVEHFLEVWALGYRVAALHRGIVEPVDDGIAGGLGVALDRRPLSRLAVLVMSRPTFVADDVRM
jgi:hypothetical protein